MIKCDVIIPIYNAYDYVKKCIGTVIENTDLKTHSMILIDDHSPDERILPLLDEVKSSYPELNITVLKNEANLGFVKSVNLGMKYSENDVLLLNSDTEVCRNWLDNIIKCAYSSEDVGTVTPLSNNATLVSAPIGLQANELPGNLSFCEYTELVDKCSYKEYPLLPTAHGFCMYIRRHALDIVGYFDEINFGKGYGEENDFSFRCLENGLKHLLCDNVLIFHKESQSFTESKIELIQEHSKQIKMMYPKWMGNIDVWCADFPIQHICKNIQYNIGMVHRDNVLFLIHDWSNLEHNVGGTTLHCKDLIHELRKTYNIHVFHASDGTFKVNSYFEKDESEMSFAIPYDAREVRYYNSDYAKLLKEILAALSISLVHVHHLCGHYFDVANVCREMKIPILMTLHDYYCLCPTSILLSPEKKCCINEACDCQNCLSNKGKSKFNIIPEWRRQYNILLEKMDCIITPSISTKKMVESYYPSLNCLPIEHGVHLKKSVSELKLDKIVNIAFVGVMAEHKGLASVEYLVKHMNPQQVHFHLFGTTESKILQNAGNIQIHGKYNREELPELLHANHIHIVANLSILPETYSYTLTETVASGIPVLSYDLGAVGERINQYGLGWTIDLKDGNKGLERKLLDIISNEKEYAQIIDNINQYEIKTVEKMRNEYGLIYQQFIHDHDDSVNYDLLKALIKKDKSHEVNKLSEELNRILNSRKWRFMAKFRTPDKIRSLLDKWGK